jgi:hypothetical protein
MRCIRCYLLTCAIVISKVTDVNKVESWRNNLLLWELQISLISVQWHSKICIQTMQGSNREICSTWSSEICYTECPRRNMPDFGRVFLMLKYADITQNTYVQSWTVTEIMAREIWNFDRYYTLVDWQWQWQWQWQAHQIPLEGQGPPTSGRVSSVRLIGWATPYELLVDYQIHIKTGRNIWFL